MLGHLTVRGPGGLRCIMQGSRDCSVGHRPSWSQAQLVTGPLRHRPTSSQVHFVTGQDSSRAPVHEFVCVCVCVCVKRERERERESERKREREGGRETERERDCDQLGL